MSRLSELSDAELSAKSIEYSYRFEMSGGTRFIQMVDAIQREKGKRFWKTYRRPSKSRAREIDSNARTLFTKGKTK